MTDPTSAPQLSSTEPFKLPCKVLQATGLSILSTPTLTILITQVRFGTVPTLLGWKKHGWSVCDRSELSLSLWWRWAVICLWWNCRFATINRYGLRAIVRTRMLAMEGVQINWDYRIESADSTVLFATAQVTLVAVDRDKGKILRQLPPAVEDALVKLSR